jgi:hypothetical protein
MRLKCIAASSPTTRTEDRLSTIDRLHFPEATHRCPAFNFGSAGAQRRFLARISPRIEKFFGCGINTSLVLEMNHKTNDRRRMQHTFDRRILAQTMAWSSAFLMRLCRRRSMLLQQCHDRCDGTPIEVGFRIDIRATVYCRPTAQTRRTSLMFLLARRTKRDDGTSFSAACKSLCRNALRTQQFHRLRYRQRLILPPKTW